MAVPSPTQLLAVWDAGVDQDHTGRSLLLLSLNRQALGFDALISLSIGRRDGMLLDLRERLFGSRFEAVEQCPSCGTDLELAFDVEDIRVALNGQPGGKLHLTCDDQEVEVRLPTTDDLLAIRSCRDAAEARQRLFARCVLTIDGESGAELSEAAQAKVAQALGEADPQADIELTLQCAECGQDWQSHFDIVRYLWAEIEHYGQRTLHDVHRLARAYGWSETEALALSPRRRGRYLEMVDDG